MSCFCVCMHRWPHWDTVSSGCVVTSVLGHFGPWSLWSLGTAIHTCRILSGGCSEVRRVSRVRVRFRVKLRVRDRCVQGLKCPRIEVTVHCIDLVHMTTYFPQLSLSVRRAKSLCWKYPSSDWSTVGLALFMPTWLLCAAFEHCIQHIPDATNRPTNHPSNNYGDMVIVQFFKMAAVRQRHLGFAFHVSGPPTKHISWSLLVGLCKIWLESMQ